MSLLLLLVVVVVVVVASPKELSREMGVARAADAAEAALLRRRPGLPDDVDDEKEDRRELRSA